MRPYWVLSALYADLRFLCEAPLERRPHAAYAHGPDDKQKPKGPLAFGDFKYPSLSSLFNVESVIGLASVALPASSLWGCWNQGGEPSSPCIWGARISAKISNSVKGNKRPRALWSNSTRLYQNAPTRHFFGWFWSFWVGTCTSSVYVAWKSAFQVPSCRASLLCASMDTPSRPPCILGRISA